MKRVGGETFPAGTLVVNVLGCLLLGYLIHISSQQWKLILGVGFLGALTTFSTFGVETISKLKAGHVSLAALNVFLNLTIGFAAVWLGMTLAKLQGLDAS